MRRRVALPVRDLHGRDFLPHPGNGISSGCRRCAPALPGPSTAQAHNGFAYGEFVEVAAMSSAAETQSVSVFASPSPFRTSWDHACPAPKTASSAKPAAAMRSHGQTCPASRVRRIRRVEKPAGIAAAQRLSWNSTPRANRRTAHIRMIPSPSPPKRFNRSGLTTPLGSRHAHLICRPRLALWAAPPLVNFRAGHCFRKPTHRQGVICLCRGITSGMEEIAPSTQDL